MYGSQFDGNAAFSGGGFMPSQATQLTESSSAPARNNQGLMPLTVKQINDALPSSTEKTTFVVDGVDVNNVTVVGTVYDKEERVTDISFILDDGTGRLVVHRWVNEATEQNEATRIENGKYVRVFGHLKGHQDKRELVAFSVSRPASLIPESPTGTCLYRPIVDFNEITYHFTECMYVHSYNMKLQKAGNPKDGADPSALNGNQYRGNQAIAPPNQVQGQPGADGMQGIEHMILEYLNQPSILAIEKGAHVDELGRQLSAPVAKIMQSMNILEHEGLVYSTIDDYHFKSTANG